MKLFYSFRYQIVVRLIVIISLGLSGIYILTQTYFWLVSVWLLLFFCLSVYELIRYLERVKYDLTSFLISIRQKDFSGNYSQKLSSKHDLNLYAAFKTITREFQQLRKEKESNYHFLQAAVEHSTVPMLSYKENDGKVILMNDAARTLFKRPFLNNVEALKKTNTQLLQILKKLKSGEKELLKTTIGNEFLNLSISAKELKLDDIWYKLVSFQNIKAELDEKELESWQKLIRVLTHEIKNSAIPISTLTEVINQMITENDGSLKDLSRLDSEDLNDLKVGIKTVEKRSKGLVSFVNAYGELARVPKPKLQQLAVKELINDVLALLKGDLQKNNVKYQTHLQSYTILADRDLIEQVLINLIKNAREAMVHAQHPSIKITSSKYQGKIIIAIEDNGPGINHETLENIFIPFYTTKKHGSGIGLSLSRQIMRAHKGNLTVSSGPSGGTTFYMQF